MGWERRGQHVSKLVLHAKQVYFMPQSLNPASYTPSDTFLTNTQSPSQTPGLGGWGSRGRVKQFLRDLIADNASSVPWKRDLLGTFLSVLFILTQNPTLVPRVPVPPCLPCAARADPFRCF